MNNTKLSLILLCSLTAGCANEGWSDIDNVEPTPDAATQPDAHKKYEKFCDFAVPLIQDYCQHAADCGQIENSDAQLDVCFHAYFDFAAALRCEVPLDLPDSHYDACLAGFADLTCPWKDELPPGCTFFEKL